MLIPTESINFVDVFLEGLKALVTLILVIVIWRAGRKYPQLGGGSWGLITFGFVLMFIGFLFDVSDEIINYDASEFAATAQTVIEEVSLIGGLILVTIGFANWFAFVGRFLGLKSES